MNRDTDDKSRPYVETRASGITVIHDDFQNGLNPEIWSAEKIEPGRLTFQSAQGINIARIEIHRGDRQEINKFGKVSERDELLEPKNLQLPIGVNAWYAFSFYFPPDFPIVDNRTVFAQWKQKGESESPFLSLRYQKGELFCRVIGDEVNEKFRQKQPQEMRGQWHRVVMNYQLNPNLSGKVYCKLDEQELVNYEGKLGHQLLEPSTYFKMGLYRDQLETPQTICLAQYRRGPTEQDCVI